MQACQASRARRPSAAGRRTCSNRNGRNCATAALDLKGCNGSDEDVLTYAMFPQVAPKFFGTRSQGPKNLGKDPAEKPAPAPVPATPPAESAAANGKGPVRTPITYNVKLNGKTHRVTVAPE